MKSPFTIEKNVPISKLQKKFEDYWPFEDMKKGDSFVVDDLKLSRAAYAYAHNRGIKCITRKIEGGGGKYRVWKVSARASRRKRIK